ncbi:hypothetical protein ABVT39_022270 [Epinephelus coioides]
MSTWGRNANLFFSHLIALSYFTDADSVYICGDFNSRIADLRDYIEEDDISPRVILDTANLRRCHDAVVNPLNFSVTPFRRGAIHRQSVILNVQQENITCFFNTCSVNKSETDAVQQERKTQRRGA